MPTTRARHTITETDKVTLALDEAAKRWPEDGATRTRLLLRLVEEGYRALCEERRQQTEKRRAAIRRTSGVVSGLYPPGYLADLRAEWPE